MMAGDWGIIEAERMADWWEYWTADNWEIKMDRGVVSQLALQRAKQTVALMDSQMVDK